MSEQWEPGPPSPRAFLPSAIFGGVVPFVVYLVVRSRVHSDAEALIIAGAFPAAFVLIEWVRKRQIDPIGVAVLFGFTVGIIVSEALGGNAFVLKVRDAAFTAMFGLICLSSLFWRRPAMFYIGRVLSAGDEPDKVAAYNLLYEAPEGPHTFRVITAVWGVGFLVEATLRVLLALALPTAVFLAISPIPLGLITVGMFVFTTKYARAAIRRGIEQGEVLPTVETVGQETGAEVASVEGPAGRSPFEPRPLALPAED